MGGGGFQKNSLQRGLFLSALLIFLSSPLTRAERPLVKLNVQGQRFDHERALIKGIFSKHPPHGPHESRDFEAADYNLLKRIAGQLRARWSSREGLFWVLSKLFIGSDDSFADALRLRWYLEGKGPTSEQLSELNEAVRIVRQSSGLFPLGLDLDRVRERVISDYQLYRRPRLPHQMTGLLDLGGLIENQLELRAKYPESQIAVYLGFVLSGHLNALGIHGEGFEPVATLFKESNAPMFKKILFREDHLFHEAFDASDRAKFWGMQHSRYHSLLNSPQTGESERSILLGMRTRLRQKIYSYGSADSFFSFAQRLVEPERRSAGPRFLWDHYREALEVMLSEIEDFMESFFLISPSYDLELRDVARRREVRSRLVKLDESLRVLGVPSTWKTPALIAFLRQRNPDLAENLSDYLARNPVSFPIASKIVSAFEPGNGCWRNEDAVLASFETAVETLLREIKALVGQMQGHAEQGAAYFSTRNLAQSKMQVIYTKLKAFGIVGSLSEVILGFCNAVAPELMEAVLEHSLVPLPKLNRAGICNRALRNKAGRGTGAQAAIVASEP